MISHSELRLKPEGFALVVTLIMVVLAAVIVVVMLSSATLERATAKSGNDRYQAEVAVQNGLEAAKKVLIASPTAGATSITADDTFLVLRAEGRQAANSSGNKDAYYYMAKAKPGNANIDCYPLFAGGQQTPLTINLTTNTVSKPAPPTAPFSNPAQETFGTTTKVYPQLLPFHQPAYTQWQEIRDPNDTATAPAHSLPYQRYTFWVEDVAGYVDASVAGNKNFGGKHQRTNGTNPNEIALFTLFDPAPPIDSGATLARNIIDNRPLLFTVPTLSQVAPPPSGQADVTQRNMAVRVVPDSEQALIPFGYGYGQEGTPKKNLNERLDKLSSGGITSASLVSEIGAWIHQKMPPFETRGGGMISQDYLDNTAANIIDYADTDTTPTTGNSNKYRGIDSYPFIMSLYDLLEWKRTVPPQPPNTNWTVEIKKTTYVQLWNPSDRNISGALTINYANTDTIRVNTSVVLIHRPNYNPNPGVTLRPNEFVAIKLDVTDGSDTKSYNWGPTQPASNAYIPITPQNDTNTVTVLWNNVPVDRALGGLRHPLSNSTTSMKLGTLFWHGNTAAPIFPAFGAFGDPRASWFLKDIWKSASYDTTSYWGGRVTGSGFALQPSTWPDSGHDFQAGKNPNGVTDLPPAVIARATQSQVMPPAKFNNTGTYASVAELGNLFDPAKWTIVGTSFSSTNDGGDILATAVPAPGTSAAPSTDVDGGGGFTLRIGRREFTKFDQNLKRAWQLLDIFAAGAKTDVIARRSTAGLVNLNTASRETLRTLCANITNSDPALGTPLNPPFNATQADRFADAVIAARPFLSEAQMSAIKLDPTYVASPTGAPPGPAPTPFFGNTKQWQTSVRPAQLSDAGFEDLFARMYNLSSVRSRNFRVFVTGQAVDKNDKVLSTVSKVFQVYMNPHRNASGAPQQSLVEVTYEASL